MTATPDGVPLAGKGFTPLTFSTQAHQTDIPAAYLSPGVTAPVVLVAGPDGVQRPLRVAFVLHRCDTCGALVQPGDTLHAKWHAGEFA